MSDEFSQGRTRGPAINGIIRTAIRLLAAIAAALLIAWALGGCGTPTPEATVSGTVTYQQPAEPVPGTVVIVQIQDISQAGAQATVVGEQTIRDPGPVPVAFAVAYDPAAIDEGHDYIVHARVEDGSGNLLHTTMQNYAVITQGHPTQNVSVSLEMVGSGAPPAEAKPSGETPPGEATVSGTVTYQQPAEPVPGTVVIVQIQDISQAGAQATVVGEQTIRDPESVPVAFAVAYDLSAIDEGHAYIVHARVEDGSGNLLHTTMQNYAVITQGHPTENIAVVLERIGGAAPTTGAKPSGETPPGEATVSGTVTYQQPAEPVPGTVVIVQIQDISQADAPAAVVGEQTIRDPESVPVAFTVAYDPAAIDEGHAYIVHARVEDGSGNLLYTTMQNYAVITQGHPTENIAVVLEKIGGSTTPP